MQQEKNAGFGVLPSTAVAGAEEQQELQAPTMAHCAMHNKHLASCAVICGQTLALAATELGKGQRVKDKPWEQKTKLDQLIHANLFRSFWWQDNQSWECRTHCV